MHAALSGVLAVRMTVVQVVDVIAVHYRCMPAAGSVGVPVLLGLPVLDGRHAPLLGRVGSEIFI